MSEEITITKEDLVLWLDRPPSNDDLDLCEYLANAVQNRQKYYEENQQLKEQLKDEENWRVKIAKENSSNVSECLKLIEQKKQYKSVLDEIREYSLDLHLYDNESLEFKISNDLLQMLDKVKQ